MFMEFIAQSKSVRMTPRKVRLVADLIRNKKAEQALTMLSLLNKRAALPIQKTLKSAIANAVNNAKAERAGLMIKSVEVGQGPFLKRFRPSTRGRAHPYKKRSSHIKITLIVSK